MLGLKLDSAWAKWRKYIVARQVKHDNIASSAAARREHLLSISFQTLKVREDSVHYACIAMLRQQKVSQSLQILRPVRGLFLTVILLPDPLSSAIAGWSTGQWTLPCLSQCCSVVGGDAASSCQSSAGIAGPVSMAPGQAAVSLGNLG